MIENWKKAWKLYSVQALAVLALLAELEPHVPLLANWLPEHWVTIAAAVVLFARLVAQSKDPGPHEIWSAAKEAAEKAKTVLLVLCLCLCVGCTEPRPPQRDACYLAADAEASRSYLTECGEYPDTRTCPAGDAIEARHQAAQEACK